VAKDTTYSLADFIRTLILFTRVPSSRPTHLPGTPSHNTTALDRKGWHEFGGNTRVQLRADTILSIWEINIGECEEMPLTPWSWSVDSNSVPQQVQKCFL
jgi:hypothetical protein